MRKIFFPNLKSIELKDYSLYPGGLNFKFKFVNGVNLIFGGNGVGKTTFINIIKYGIIGGYKKDFGHRRIYKGRQIEGRQEWPNNYFKNRMDDAYSENEKASVTINFLIGKAKFEVTRSLYELRLDSVKITEGTQTYFLEGIVASQSKYEGLEEDEKNEYLQKNYENKIVELSNFTAFDDLIFFMNIILFFEESHKTILWDEDGEDILGRLSSKYFNEPELDLAREKAINNAQYYDSLGRHKSEDIRAINNVIKSIQSNENTNIELKNALEEIEKTKSKIVKSQNKLNTIHLSREKITNDRKIKNNDKNFIAKDISSMESKIFDAEQKAYKQIWSKLNPKYKIHHEHIKLNHACPMCNKALPNKKLNLILNNDENCFFCEQQLIIKEKVDEEIKVLNSRIKPVLMKQQQIDADLIKMKEKIEDLDLDYQNHNQKLFESESYLRNLEHGLNEKNGGSKENFEFKAMLAEINKLEIEKKNLLDKAKIENEKVKVFTEKIETENQRITNELSLIFSEYAQKFLGLPSKLTYTDFKDNKGRRFVPVINGKPRTTSEELSESQRFFIDHSYRMSLLQFFYNAPSLFVCETPDSSLDISYERNAADVFLTYLLQPNTLIITSNLNNSGFLEYIIDKADKINYINLLDIGRKSPIQASSPQLKKILEKIKLKLDAKIN